MSRSGKTLWVITVPVYKPAPGGAAIYSDTIARALVGAGDDALILSESFPGSPTAEDHKIGDGTLMVRRFLPYRAGRAQKDLRSILSYALANVHYLRLPGIVNKASRRSGYDAVVCIVHSSFLYNPGLMGWVLGRLRGAGEVPARVVLDVRDYQFPDSQLHWLGKVDNVITSSIGVAEELAQRAPEARDRIVPISMPFEGAPALQDEQVDQVLKKHGLARRGYLFNPNGISNAKCYPLIREALPLIRSRDGFETMIVATAGRKRDWTEADESAESAGLTRFLGPLPHAEILALMQGAHATLVLSEREAISRAALEAMWAGGRVVLPDLSEFRRDCPEHVCGEKTAEAVADMVAAVDTKPAPRYGFERHSAASFLDDYLGLAVRA